MPRPHQCRDRAEIDVSNQQTLSTVTDGLSITRDGSDLQGETLSAGSHTLQATAGSGASGGGNTLGALEASFTVFTPVTVSTENVAANHAGTANFTFDLRFSENVVLSYVTLRDHAFEVTNGNVRGARRLAAPSNIQWRITVDRSGNAAVRIQLGTTTDCDADGAVCTYDGRKLSGGLDLTVTKGP